MSTWNTWMEACCYVRFLAGGDPRQSTKLRLGSVTIQFWIRRCTRLGSDAPPLFRIWTCIRLVSDTHRLGSVIPRLGYGRVPV